MDTAPYSGPPGPDYAGLDTAQVRTIRPADGVELRQREDVPSINDATSFFIFTSESGFR